jgi:D-serine deaminase-like pyridoxal phosphate-dependent protein
MEWYTVENIDTIDSPALLIYKERVRENIRKAVEMIKDVSHLRPHVKTNKISEVCRMMMAEGISKFKCATISEAEMLAMINAPDVLLAYQPVGPKAERLLNLAVAYPNTKFSCLIDNIDSAERLSNLFASKAKTIDVFIDLNTGMNRSGIVPDRAFELFEGIKQVSNIKLIGLHGYDGHIRTSDVKERQAESNSAFDSVTKLAASIESKTKRALIIVAGGSPTFPTHLQRNVECSPGTFVFWDWGYKNSYPDEPFEYAVLVLTRVISVIDETTICTDLGHKSVAAENPLPRVHFLNAEEAVPLSQSEEHLVLKVPHSTDYRVGDVLYGVPVHICPTVALYEEAVVVERNKALGRWRVIARDRKINI